MRFRCFFFLSHHLLFDLMYFLSLDESYSLNEEYDYDDSDSRSSGTYYFCAFSLRFDDSVGSVSGLGSGIFHQQDSIPKVIFLRLTCSYQQQLSTKVVNSLKFSGAQTPYFISKFEAQFYNYSRNQNLPHSLQPL